MSPQKQTKKVFKSIRDVLFAFFHGYRVQHRQPKLLMNHTRNTIWPSNYKGLYGIFYKISMKVVKSENVQ